MIGQRRLDLLVDLLASPAVDLIGQSEHSPIVLDADEPTGLEQRLRLGSEAHDDVIAPDLDQLVAGRERDRCQWGSRRRGCWFVPDRWRYGRGGGRHRCCLGPGRSRLPAHCTQRLRTRCRGAGRGLLDAGASGGGGPGTGFMTTRGSGGVGLGGCRSVAGRGRPGVRRGWRGRGSGERDRCGTDGGLEPLDPGQDGLRRVVCLRVGQPYEGDVQIDPGIGRIAHGDLGPPQHLQGPHQRRQPHPLGLGGKRLPLGPGDRHQPRCHQGQEPLAEVVDQVAGQLLGAEPGGRQVGHRHQGAGDVPFGEGLDDLVELGQVVVDGIGRRHLVEHRERVPSRSTATPDGQVQRLVGNVEVRVLAHLGQQLTERLGAEEAELEVLGAAADGGQHLLGVGGGQHEDDVGGRLLERLEQGVGGGRREHVDLVDDVDLLAARRSQCRTRHQVAHGVHPVVRRGVELVHVERGAFGDLDTGGTHAARLAVLQVGAVERLGQNPGRRGLAGPPRPTEQVGVCHAAVPDRVAEGEHDVVLATDLAEGRRSESPIERLIGNVVGSVGHVGGAYRPPGPASPGGSGRPSGEDRAPRCSVRRPDWLRHTA